MPVTRLFPEVTITIPSNRIYLDEIVYDGEPKDAWKPRADSLKLTLKESNILKEWYYNKSYNARYPKKGQKKGKAPTVQEVHEFAKKTFGHDISDYTVASLFSTVSGIMKSQVALQKRYARDRDLRMQKRKQKIAITLSQLERAKVFKATLATFHKANHRYPSRTEIKIPRSFAKRYPDGTPTEKEFQKNAYQFECWLDREIQFYHSSLYHLHQAQKRDRDRKFKVPRRVTFGSRRQYRLKDTVALTPRQRKRWHEERDDRRTRQMNISGRHTSKYGNYACRYDPENHTVDLDLLPIGQSLHLNNVFFPYRGKELLDNYQTLPILRHSVGYQILLRRDDRGREYILIKATILLEQMTVADTSKGVIGLDINADQLDWAELNQDGCLMDGGPIAMLLDGKRSGWRKSITGHVCKQIIDLCIQTGKPLVMENINLDNRKAKLKYDSRKGNRIVSSFNYAQITEHLVGLAFQFKVPILFVNPAYTSNLAEIKYMKNRRGPIHLSAAVTIGRRGMGYSEKIPGYLYKAICNGQNKGIKATYDLTHDIPREIFYRKLPDFKTKTDFLNYVQNFI